MECLRANKKTLFPTSAWYVNLRQVHAGLTEDSESEASDREGEPTGESAIDEEVNEEEEEEPRLKYHRLGADVSEILSGNAASCLCVSDKLVALGVHDGTVHVLDVSGNEVSICYNPLIVHKIWNGSIF